MPAVLETIPEDKRAKSLKSLDFDPQLPSERVLGIDWCLETDTLGYRVNLKEKPITRRGVLSVVSSFFDPKGLAGPVTLVAKQLIQSMCLNSQVTVQICQDQSRSANIGPNQS